MFAIREVPQSSTGFSPFELLYGKNPRSVLDLVREKWGKGDRAQINIKQVLEMRDHFAEVYAIARRILENSQRYQKGRYDKKKCN